MSCGEGFRSRQVTCKRTRANGTVQALPPRVCILRDRPLGRRPCSSHPCVQGLFEQGNQVMLTNLVFKNHPVPVVKPTYPKRDFPWQSSVRTLPSNARDVGSIPGRGTKIPYAMRPKHKTSNTVTKPHPSGPFPTGERRAQTPAGHSGNSSAQGADHTTHQLVLFYPRPPGQY